MSVHYDLYVNQHGDLKSLSDLVVMTIAEQGFDVMPPHVSNEKHVTVGADVLTIIFRPTTSVRLKLLQECYGVQCDTDVMIMPIHSAGYPRPQRCMMGFVDALLRRDNNDLVLEFNGELNVLYRKDSRLFINHTYDDGSKFPFHVLSAPYEVVHMPV